MGLAARTSMGPWASATSRALGISRLKREPRPGSERQASHDGEAEPQALGAIALGVGELVILLEYLLLLVRRYAGSSVPDLHPEARASATTHNNASAIGVACRVGDEVPQDALDQDRIGEGDEPAANAAQVYPLGGGFRGVLAAQAVEQGLDGEGARANLHDPGIEARDVEQGAEQAVGRRHRSLDLIDDMDALRRHGDVPQGADEEAERMDGLAQVVAGCGQEGRFREVGLLGQLLLAAQAVGQHLGLDAKADQFREVPVGGQSQTRHDRHEDDHQRPSRLLQGMGRHQAPDRERHGGGKEHGGEGRQIEAERRDRSHRQGEAGVDHQHLGVEPAVADQPHRRPAPADPFGEADHGEAGRPRSPSPPDAGPALEEMAQDQVSDGARGDVTGPDGAPDRREDLRIDEHAGENRGAHDRAEHAHGRDAEKGGHLLGAQPIIFDAARRRRDLECAVAHPSHPSRAFGRSSALARRPCAERRRLSSRPAREPLRLIHVHEPMGPMASPSGRRQTPPTPDAVGRKACRAAIWRVRAGATL